jgi:gliding motility-associated-like protein
LGDGTFINTPFLTSPDSQTHTYTAAGVYTVTLSVTGDCGLDTYSEEICIEPEVTASYTLDTEEGCIPLAVAAQNTIDESELCEASEPTYNWTVTFEDINCNLTSDWEFINGTDASSENPQFLFNNPGNYTVTQNVTTNCGSSSTQKIISVKKPPTVSINPIEDFCQPGLINPTAIIENCTDNLAEVTYNWSFPGGSPSSSTIENPENIAYDTPGVYTITLEVTNECGTTSATQEFEVLEKPVITNLITTQEICSNQSTIAVPLTSSNPNTTYTWTSTTVPNNTDISGFISSGSTAEIPSQTLINNGNTPGNVVYTVTPILNNCIGDPVDVLTVVVNPTPTIVTQPVDSEVCLDGVANQLTIVTQNGVGTPTYQWYTNTTNSNSGGTPIAGATNSTYDPPTNTVGEIFYYVTIAFEGGCDLISSDVASVMVVQEPVAVANNPLQIVCLDGTPDDFQITLTGGLGNPSYQWYSNTTNSNTGGTLIVGATASTYNPGVLTTISSNYYYVEVTLDGVGCDTTISDVFSVEVVSDPVIDTQAIAAQEVCQNASLLELTITVSGGIASSNFDYQWYSNTTNNNTGGTPITGANTNTYTPDNTTIGTLYYYVVITQNESGCEVISTTSKVIITPGPTIVTQPVDSEVCLDGVANQLTIVTQNGVGTPTYQWYTNTTNSNSGGTPIAGATNSTYDPPTNTVGEIFYYVTIAFEGGCDLISSDVASVMVVQEPVAVANNPLQIVCLDGTPDDFQITLTGGLGNPSYQWYSNTTNSNTGGTLIVGATASTYNPGVLTTISSNYYYVEVTLDGVGCDTTISDVFSVEVVSDPVIDTQAVAAQEVCQNASLLELTITVSGGIASSNFDYQWYSNTTNNNTGGTPITGANTNTYTPDNTTIGTLYYYVVITQNESGCEVISTTSKVIITPGPTIVTQPVDSEVCLDGVANQLTIVTQNGVGTPTYQWYTNTTNSNSGGTPIAGATNSTYDPPTNTVGEIFYYVTIAFEGGCDLISSDVASVMVVQEPVAVANNPLQIVCLDGTPDDFQITLTGGLGNPSYQWYSNTTNSNTGGTLIVGATASTYNPGVLTTISSNYYYVEVTLDGVGCDTTISDVFSVEVVSDPVIDTQAIAAQEVCQNASLLELTITVSGGIASSNFDYQWYSNTTNNNTGGTPITGANTNTYTPDNTTIGTLYYYVVITQNESGCEVISTTSKVIITPGPTIVTQPVDSEVCLDGVANQLTIVTQNGVGTPTYQWYTNTTNSNSGGTPIAGATNSTYDPPTNTVGEIFYYVTIAFEGGCDLISSDVASVMVVQEPVAVANNPLQIVCLDGTPDDFQITLTGGLGNPSYQWYSNTTNSNTGGTLIVGATASTYNPGVLTTISSNYYYVEVTLDGVGCDTTISDVFSVEVVSDPVIDTQAIAAQEVCQNASLLELTITVSGGIASSNFDYQWYSNTTNNNTGGTPITGANTNTYTPDNTTIGTLYYYVVITQNESGCEVISTTSKVIITPGPTIVTQPVDSEVCLDGVANQLTIVTQNGVGTPTYQWYTNTTNSNSGGTPIAGATNSTYDPPTNTVGEIFYYVTIAFEGGCDLISSDVASVMVVQEPVAVANNPLQIVCLDGTPDDFQITLTGGLGNPSYQWYSNTTNSNTGGTLIVGATASTYNPGVLTTISSNYYYVEVTLDGVGCDTTISDVFSVEVVSDPVIDTQAIAAQEVCQNASLLELTITVSGGIASSNFDYQWYSNTTNNNTGGTPITGANTNTYTPDNTTIGTLYYYVVITQNESGCEVISTTSKVIITPGPTIVTQPVDSEVCLDGVANQLTIVTQNGVGTPTYQWYTNTTNSNSGGTPIAGATNSTYDPPTNTVGEIFYYVTIAFEGGCDLISSDVASVMVNEIPVIDTAEITIYSEETFLFDPSSVAGNIVPIGTTYTWSAPTSSNPGTIVGSSSESSPQTNISQTLENISSPPEPVTETYVITPATPSCTGQPFILIVTVNPSIISNVEITNNSCFESNNGILSTNITGGVPFTSGPPYLISWTGPNSFTSTASNIINLLAGDYILRIEDSNGVFVIEEYTVSQPDLLRITTDVEKNISCFDGNDGAIEVSITGGTAPYTYNWTGDGVVQGSPSQSGLSAGTYSLEVVDDELCVINQTYILTEPDIIVINTVSKNDILCFGDATGAIEINITGGTPTEVSPGIFEYGYSWTGPNSFTSNAQNISNLLAGTYTIEVTDELGCIERRDIELTQPTAIEIDYTKTDVTCYGEADGSIDISVNGGNPPYQISWSNLGNGFSQSNLSAGNYIATIIDENLCEVNVTITIEQPIFFIAPIVNPISCNDANDASIDLNLTGGIAPITVLWSDDPSAGIQRNNLSAGSYTVTITDSDTNQCPIEETFIITNPPELSVTSIVNDAIDCDVSNSGSIELDVSGGTQPYTFLWNTGQTSEDIFNIPSGDYSVEIKDNRGCIINREYTIFRQEPIIISLEETVIPDCNSNTINVQNIPKVTGGFLPYTYSWSSGVISGSNNEIMTTNQSGAYVLTVTDGRGCQESVSIQVDVPEVGFPEFTYESLSLTQYSFVSIQDPIQFFNLSTGNFTNVSWDFGDGSPIMNSLNPEHTYDQVGTFTVTLTVEYDYGCTYQITQDINVTKGYLLVIPNAFSPNEDGINDVVRPSFRGFTTIRMLVYDTWGTLVYEEEGTSLEGWNGFINEKPAENGNYIMYVNGITFFGQEIKKSTSITILK